MVEVDAGDAVPVAEVKLPVIFLRPPPMTDEIFPVGLGIKGDDVKFAIAEETDALALLKIALAEDAIEPVIFKVGVTKGGMKVPVGIPVSLAVAKSVVVGGTTTESDVLVSWARNSKKKRKKDENKISIKPGSCFN